MNFSSQISKWKDKEIKNLTRTFRGSAMEIFRGVILRTPVLTGRLIGNWRISVNSVDKSTSEELDPTGANAFGRTVRDTKKAKLGDSIYMTNNLDYAYLIENGKGGTNGRKPVGMVSRTIQ